MLVRDAPAGDGTALEVFMVRRNLNADFIGGAYVFPGGSVDPADRGPVAERWAWGRTDTEASALLGVDGGGLAYWVAALREAFEEAGLLFAYPPGAEGGDRLVSLSEPGAAGRFAAHRVAVNAGERRFLHVCEEEGLHLAADRVHYFSHWVTPEEAPKRFDTRFFVAAAPAGQALLHDEGETVASEWVRPSEALRRQAAGELEMMLPTMKNLQAIDRFATSTELLAAAAAVEEVPTVLPRVVADDRGFRILLPGDDGYADAVSPLPVAGAPEKIQLHVDADGRGRLRS